MYNCRRHRNLDFTELYKWGLKFANRIYYVEGFNELSYSPVEAVNEAILYLNKRLQERNFESESHIKYYFRLVIRGKINSLRKSFYNNKSFSYHKPLYRDSSITFEDYIASRYYYPILEDEELKDKVDNAMCCLDKWERDCIYQVWVQGKSVKEIKGNKKLVERTLKKAKLKLSRRMFVS